MHLFCIIGVNIFFLNFILKLEQLIDLYYETSKVNFNLNAFCSLNACTLLSLYSSLSDDYSAFLPPFRCHQAPSKLTTMSQSPHASADKRAVRLVHALVGKVQDAMLAQ